MKTKITLTLKKLSLVGLMVMSVLVTKNVNAQQTGLSRDEAVTSYGANNINDISVYPRPTRNFVILKAEVTVTSTINMKVMNILGTTLIERTETSSVGNYEHEFDLSQFANGMYLLEIRSADQVITTRLIKN